MHARIGWSLLLAATLPLLLIGCGERTVAKSKAKAPTKPAKLVQTVKPQPAVSPTAFSTVAEALDAVETMSTSGNASSQELMTIERWLELQGQQAAPALSAALSDSEQHLAVRITACRALSKLGPPAKSPLLEATSAKPRQLRLKATECLGRIQPTDAAIVTKLVALMQDEDFDQRKAALTALANIGPSASKADPKLPEKLGALLNDPKEDETIRGLAKTALKKVDPRTGLQNAH